jgi:hypothetical protein
VVFERSNGALSGIDAMIVWWDQLYFDVVAADEAGDCFLKHSLSMTLMLDGMSLVCNASNML